MSTYTYTKSFSKLPALFDCVANKGVPPKVTRKWLESLGFTSSNDSSLIPVLKSLNFIDGNNAPTEFWTKYRSDNAPVVLAEAIRNTYEDLFATHPNAHQLDASALTSYFRANTRSGEDTVKRTVNTFSELARLAEFNGDLEPPPVTGNAATLYEKSDSGMPASLSSASSQQKTMYQGQPVTINLNVELQLPATDDQSVYDAFFAAMRKHLLSGGA